MRAANIASNRHDGCAADLTIRGPTVEVPVALSAGSSSGLPISPRSARVVNCGVDRAAEYIASHSAPTSFNHAISSTACLNHRCHCQHRRRAGITSSPPLSSSSMSAIPSAPASAAPSVPSLHRQHRRLQFRSLPLRHRQRWQPRHR
jgi:hypothetical protein